MKLLVVADSRLPDMKSQGGTDVGIATTARPVLVLRLFRTGFRSSEEEGLLADRGAGLDQTSGPKELSVSGALCRPLGWPVGGAVKEPRL